MIQPEQLAQRIVKGILKHKIEINQPKWMYHMLKFYQLVPRTLERLLPRLFRNKSLVILNNLRLIVFIT